MVAKVWFGIRFAGATPAGCGWLTEYEVLTTKPSGVTWPSVTRFPVASSVARMPAGAFG